MSRQTARVVLDQINGRPALVSARYAGAVSQPGEVTSWGLLSDVQEISAADVDALERAASVRRRELVAAYSPFGADDPSKPFAFADGKAIVPIHGMLLSRFPYSWGFATGYNFIQSQLSAAMADPDVTSIIYDVNSYGGLSAGCQECSDAMFAASARQGGKPSLAVVDSNCYSAAYWLSSAADKIAITPSGGAGSIGVLLMHVDYSKMLEDVGLKVTFIHAGDHKVDGNPYEPLDKEVTSELQSVVDKIYGQFVGAVARNRTNLSEQAVRDTQARTYQADDALALGLVDAVQTSPDALNAFDASDDTTVDLQHQEDEMATENQTNQNTHTQADVDAAATAARTGERSRISAILNHAEAEGRTALATHLAMETDMTPEAAAGVLKNSPKAAATPAPAPAAQEQNHFKNAMNNGSNPNVGSGGEGDGTKTLSRSEQILAAQQKATGQKPKVA